MSEAKDVVTKKERDPAAHLEAQRKYAATWRKNHPEKVKALAKLWTEKRRDMCERDPGKFAAIRKAAREKQREADPAAYLKARREQDRELYKKNATLRATILGKSKKQREEHPDAYRKYAAKWRKKNREHLRAFGEAWLKKKRETDPIYWKAFQEVQRNNKRQWKNIRRAKYPELVREENLANNHNRRTLKARTSGSFTGREFRDLCSFYGDKCLRCGVTGAKLTADHVIPLSFAGGPEYDGVALNAIANIQPLCKPCNSSKNKKYIDYRLQREGEVKLQKP